MQLLQLAEHTWVIQGGANIGVIAHEGRCLIIDSGMDKDVGRDILSQVKKLGLTPTALLVTHAHADHFGGGESPGAWRMYLIETCFQLFIHMLTSSGLHSSHSTTRAIWFSQCNLICEPAPVSVSASSFE